MIELWRNKPLSAAKQCIGSQEKEAVIFPSARQALVSALIKYGVARPDRIALPEWSSQCLIGPVGKVATPLPLTEVLAYDIPVRVLVLYEQWGWPLQGDYEEVLRTQFRNSIIVFDRVESPDVNNPRRPRLYPEMTQIDLISLSKIMGLPGGGIAYCNGEALRFEADKKDATLVHHIWHKDNKPIPFRKLIHTHKNDVMYLHHDLIDWVEGNDVFIALAKEGRLRKANLDSFFNSSLSAALPEWMRNAVENGARPGIVPLFIKKDEAELERMQRFIMDELQIEIFKYHFNLAGDPFNVQYERCLAFPVHGEVVDIDHYFRAIERRLV